MISSPENFLASLFVLALTLANILWMLWNCSRDANRNRRRAKRDANRNANRNANANRNDKCDTANRNRRGAKCDTADSADSVAKRKAAKRKAAKRKAAKRVTECTDKPTCNCADCADCMSARTRATVATRNAKTAKATKRDPALSLTPDDLLRVEERLGVFDSLGPKAITSEVLHEISILRALQNGEPATQEMLESLRTPTIV